VTDRIQYLIKRTTANGIKFNDALYFSAEEFASKTQSELDALSDARLAAFEASLIDTRTPQQVADDDAAAAAAAAAAELEGNE